MRKGCAILFVLASFLCVLASCSSKKEARVISDLAYSSRNQDECIVYLQEDGEYIPFIVVTDDYNGNVLLVRKEVLPEPRRMRHLSVTLKLLWSGDVKAVQADSGHKDAEMVFNRYSHALDEERQKLALTMDERLYKKASAG